MQQQQLLVAFFCVCVLVFCPYAIFTSYSGTRINTLKHAPIIFRHNAMTLTIDGDGYRNLVFDCPVPDDNALSKYIPTISDADVLVNGSSGRRLSFEDLVELDPKLIRFNHSEEVYNLFPLHVNMSEILTNISRLVPINVSIPPTIAFYPQRSFTMIIKQDGASPTQNAQTRKVQ